MIDTTEADADSRIARKRQLRVLIATEPRLYRETIGRTIQDLRPHLEVTVVEPDALVAEVRRLAPRLIICSQANTLTLDVEEIVWVEFRPYDEPRAKICIGRQRSELEEVKLDDLLSIVDETERMA